MIKIINNKKNLPHKNIKVGQVYHHSHDDNLYMVVSRNVLDDRGSPEYEEYLLVNLCDGNCYVYDYDEDGDGEGPCQNIEDIFGFEQDCYHLIENITITVE